MAKSGGIRCFRTNPNYMVPGQSTQFEGGYLITCGVGGLHTGSFIEYNNGVLYGAWKTSMDGTIASIPPVL